MMKPVLVRAFGRTGTTLLMQLLETSKDVFIPNDYPFESRYLTYFCRMTRLMDEKNIGKTFKDGDVVDYDINTLGECPYNFDSITNPETLRKRLLFGLWNQFSEEIKATSGLPHEYYAEKVSLKLAPYISQTLPNVKSIFLVRDPRGELASIISFNKKRGFEGFGWQVGDTELTFAKRMIASRKVYFNNLPHNGESKGNNIVLRFEDIVSDLSQTAIKLNKFMSTEFNSEMVESHVANMKHHMTSQSILASRDKWKKELNDETIELFEIEMKTELDKFDFSLHRKVKD